MNNKLLSFVGVLLLSLTVPGNIIAQEKIDDGLKIVLSQDSVFWRAYNTCNVDAMRNLFTEDIEFYHDKGGRINGLENVLSVSQKNLCSNDNFRLRREPVPGTVKIFPMTEDGKIYGAILSGQHVFYVLESGKEARLDGLAKFTHLWLKTESGWKMSRVFSFDHGPAPYISPRKAIALEKKALQRYAGNYQAPHAGSCDVRQGNGTLLLTIADKHYTLHPENEKVFFVTDRDLTFEFSGDKMIVREQGKIVEEAMRVK